MYGGLLTTKSILEVSSLSIIFLFITLTLSSSPNSFIFSLANSIALSEISVAKIFRFENFLAKTIEIAPLPTPTSIIFFIFSLSIISETLSIKISVSGRGIKTPFLIFRVIS